MSRDQKKAESRRRILDAARDVFFRDGFMRANLDEMAEKAGVAKGTLYNYFSSKQTLLVGVFEAETDAMLGAGQAIIDAASRWGFWHMGQFAADYRRKFGELPSETRNRVR